MVDFAIAFLCVVFSVGKCLLEVIGLYVCDIFLHYTYNIYLEVTVRRVTRVEEGEADLNF